MPTPAPPAADEGRARVLAWLQMVLERTDWTPAELARRAHVSPSTINRAVNGEFVPTMSTLTKIVAATGIALPRDLALEPATRGFSEPEAEPYAGRPDAAAGHTERLDAWLVKGRHLELAGVLPGDIVLVDRRLPPRPRDVVQAQVYDLARGTAETVFREYDPPYLVTRAVDPAVSIKPLLVDNERVLVVGVVVRLVRQRAA